MAKSVSGPQFTHLEAELAGSRLSVAENPWHVFHFLVLCVHRVCACFCVAGAGQDNVSQSPSQLQDQDIWSSAFVSLHTDGK